jgi:hypothetical protein
MDEDGVFTIVARLYGPGTHLVHTGLSYEEALQLYRHYETMPHVMRVSVHRYYDIVQMLGVPLPLAQVG